MVLKLKNYYRNLIEYFLIKIHKKTMSDNLIIKETQKAIEIELVEIYLTREQINEIVEGFMLQVNTLGIVIESVDNEVRNLATMYLEYVKIYDGMFEKYRDHVWKKYEFALIDAGTPIGANASDAIGQQATQALLNTFHSVGTAKSGGPDGIKENIGISPNRKVVYTVIHMRNGTLSYSDVMKMKNEFIGIPISKLLLSPPVSVYVDIRQELAANPFIESLSKSEKLAIMKSERSWWYSLVNFEGFFDIVQSKISRRQCIRLTLDVQKLYEFKLLTTYIANFLNTWKFEITIPKRSGKSSNKRETADEFVFAIPSPTNIGVIDIFMKCYDDSKDHLLISLIHSEEFKNIMISGIEGITNFYAVSTNVVRLIREIEVTNRFDEEKGIKGTWLYLEDNRFNGIPYFRLLNILDKAGIKYEVPCFNTKESYKKKHTDLPFEFISHKSVPELRTRMKLRAYLFGSMTNHKIPSFQMPSYNSTGVIGLNKVNCVNDHYVSEKIGEGFDIALYPFSQSNNLDGILSTKKFANKTLLVQQIVSMEQKMTLENFFKLFSIRDDDYVRYFKEPNSQFKIINFEIEDPNGRYISYYMFQIKYIDYQINTNLDYINSRYTTQSLDSILFLQFGIPYDIANQVTNQGSVSLPDSLRQYKIYDVEKIDKPERRILLKTKMFETDKYDYLNKPHRKVLLKYYKDVDKDMFKSEKIDLLNKLLKEHAGSEDVMDEKEKEAIIDDEKLKPLDRLNAYLKERTDDSDNTYVYAETSGTNFAELLINKKVFAPKLICNHFHQVYRKLGLEGLRNILNYDMVSMINSSGYISVEYMNFLSNVTTHNGINPMTSEGISCQKRDFLSMITYDNAPKYTHAAALLAEDQYTYSTSACIFLGKLFKAGSGFVTLSIDKSKLNVVTRKEGISEGFLKLTGSAKPIGGGVLTDENEDPIVIPKLVTNKFPQVKWVLDNFIQRDILFYIQQDIDRTKSQTLTFYRRIDCSQIDDMSYLITKIKRGDKNKRP